MQPSTCIKSCLPIRSRILSIANSHSNVPRTYPECVTLPFCRTCYTKTRIGRTSLLIALHRSFRFRSHDFDVLVQNPSLLFHNVTASTFGDSFLDYRLAHNLNVPSRLRQLYSWNLNSWKVITQPEYKLRKMRKTSQARPGLFTRDKVEWNAG